MSRFLTRYEDDPSRPSVGSALRDLAVRAALPAVGQFAAIVAIGWVILGPLGGLPQESQISASIQQGRTPVWDMVTKVWSMIGNTEIIIGTCLVVVALVWWRTRQW
ncbi:MAG: phospholipid phosphatase, partial [Dermatophilaceae bacterium]